jgi:hypothetical protein
MRIVKTAVAVVVLLMVLALWTLASVQFGYSVAASQCRQVMQQYR